MPGLKDYEWDLGLIGYAQQYVCIDEQTGNIFNVTLPTPAAAAAHMDANPTHRISLCWRKNP